MTVKPFCLLLAASFCLVGSVAFAAPPVPAAFKQKLNANDVMLKGLESRAATILSRKTVGPESDNLEKEMYAYAERMKAAMDQAVSEADKAAKSGGRQGNVALLDSFETMAKAHEVRANRMAKNFERIEAGVKTGEITLDKSLLMRMSPQEKNEFKRNLTPQGLQKMERMHPDIFRPGMSGRTSLNFLDGLDGERMACAVKEAGGFLANGIGDFFVRDAEAMYAAPCIGPCIAKNWAACTACVVAIGPKAIQAWNNFVSCWNGSCSCRWYKPWCCAQKAWCLAKLIAKLA